MADKAGVLDGALEKAFESISFDGVDDKVMAKLKDQMRDDLGKELAHLMKEQAPQGRSAEAAAAPAARPVAARSVVRSVVVMSAEGRAVATAALVKVVTAAGPALRPWAARVAAAICSAVSELEPAAFAKLQWQADVVFADQVSQRSVEFRADKRGRFH